MGFIKKLITTLSFLGTLSSALASPLAEDVLKIGTMDLPPYGWQDKAGPKYGIIYELNEEIGKRSGLSYSNQILPFKRMLALLKKGEIDIVSSQAHDASLSAGDKLAIQFDIDVIAGTRKSSKIKTFQDLKNKRFIYHRSASYKQLKNYPRSIVRVNSYEQSLSLLSKNRASDASVFSEPAYYYWMKQLGFTPKDFGNVILIEKAKKQWVFIRKDYPANKRKKIKRIVEQIYKENMYNQLLNKYGKGE